MAILFIAECPQCPPREDPLVFESPELRDQWQEQHEKDEGHPAEHVLTTDRML